MKHYLLLPTIKWVHHLNIVLTVLANPWQPTLLTCQPCWFPSCSRLSEALARRWCGRLARGPSPKRLMAMGSASGSKLRWIFWWFTLNGWWFTRSTSFNGNGSMDGDGWFNHPFTHLVQLMLNLPSESWWWVGWKVGLSLAGGCPIPKILVNWVSIPGWK